MVSWVTNMTPVRFCEYIYACMHSLSAHSLHLSDHYKLALNFAFPLRWLVACVRTYACLTAYLIKAAATECCAVLQLDSCSLSRNSLRGKVKFSRC